MRVSTHLTDEQIERYWRQTLTPSELRDMDDHLAGCETCRERAADAERLTAAAASVSASLSEAERESWHPTYEAIEAYVDHGLVGPDIEVIQSHLEICVECAGIVRDLEALRSELLHASPIR